MDVKGKIKFIGSDEQVSASFVKRDIVVTTEEQYPQHILIQFTQDKTDLLDQYKIGDDVNVSINIRGREWVNPQGETKYFNTIQGWRISSVGATNTTPPAAKPPMPEPDPVIKSEGFIEHAQEDNLMF